LNETVGGVPREGAYVGLMGTLQSEAFSGININESTQTPQQITPVNEEQSKVLNVINRDFRKLMKAVDKKKTSGIGSGLVSMS
jgi:predicted ATP-binding protein involved in virulence